MVSEFRLPKIAEGGGTGTVARVLVKEGDSVRSGEALIEVETEKTVVEVPSSVEGVVKEVLVKPGDELAENALVMRIDGESATPQGTPPARGEAAASVPKKEAEPLPPAPKDVAPPAPAVSDADDPARIPAAPSVRRIARELGVPLATVPGSGPGGRISAADVQAFALGGTAGAGVVAGPLPDFARFGPVRRERVSQVRRATAEHLGRSWPLVPQVTQYDRADITELETERARHQARVEKAGGKLTVTAILVKVLAWALGREPKFNASLDLAAGEVVFKDYVHIGVAVDTERGLLVPVVRDAGKKSVAEIARDLQNIATMARDGKLTREEMAGGTFTISNLGGIGGTGFSPIVNAPEVAILGVSRSAMEPRWQDGTFVPRLILPLSLSYDHRLIDGAEAARFLRLVCEALEDPFRLVLE